MKVSGDAIFKENENLRIYSNVKRSVCSIRDRGHRLSRLMSLHTHWDREWFERADTAKPLLIGLFENLYRTVEKDPTYYSSRRTNGHPSGLPVPTPRIEKNAVRRLKACAKNLSWVLYGQIDWRIAEESAIAVLKGIRQAKFRSAVSGRLASTTSASPLKSRKS